jgi:hypothetical protein
MFQSFLFLKLKPKAESPEPISTTYSGSEKYFKIPSPANPRSSLSLWLIAES